ncbi:MAG TPA: aminotransferase class III-fold pyridoxal phosphate-dependent enzyme [Candidatus Wallbacteria bacterium]|nr:aminotransferase class III-fold pyridoxal phosphate-dependent enzyme [Candidatus Wallbacteria bacterium]
MGVSEVLNAYKMNFAPFVRPYYHQPLVVDKAEGVYVWDLAGKRYLDGYAAGATTSFGHCNRQINDAVKVQMDRYGHISHIYESELIANYSARLLDKCGKYYSKLFFVNSGFEAVDLAVMVARIFCDSDTVFTFSEGYHGGPFLSKFDAGLDALHPKAQRNDNIVYITNPECFNCVEHCNEKEHAVCIEGARDKFEKINAKGKRPILLLEPVLGVGGILTPPVHYFKYLAEMIEEYKVLLICDEIQTGFGRCGTNYFGFQKFGIQPYIICMGKSMANGYSLGAVVFADSLSHSLKDMLHFSTFGGTPISIAAANEVLNILEKSDILGTVETTGKYFCEKLKNDLDGVASITEIRGVGFFIGIEFETSEKACEVLNDCRREGFLAGIGGRKRNVLRIQPALTFSKENCDEATAILKRVLTEA